MLSRVISYNLANCQAMEDIINEWLDDVGDIHIEKCVPLGNAGPDRDAGALVIFYREKPAPRRPFASNSSQPEQAPSGVLCRQCKKRPPVEGKKTCDECRDYQKRYREQQKAEKKKSRYP
jgi:hypothetical protein